MDIPKDLKYTNDHEWARIEGDTATCGISDFAQNSLSDIVFVELPEVGTAVEITKAVGTIEAVKTVTDMYAPLSGEIIEVNGAVKDDPAIINRDPYGEGWMFKMKLSNPGEADGLLDPEAYEKVVAES
jgi:glycine cleavage system H protein